MNIPLEELVKMSEKARKNRWLELGKEFCRVISHLNCMSNVIVSMYGKGSNKHLKMHTLRRNISIVRSDFDSILCGEYDFDIIAFEDIETHEDIPIVNIFYNSKHCKEECHIDNGLQFCENIIKDLNRVIDDIIGHSVYAVVDEYLTVRSVRYIKEFKI